MHGSIGLVQKLASTAVGETAPRTTVRISDVIEVGDVEYVEEHEKFGLPCCSRYASSPGKSKFRRVPVSPSVVKKLLLKVRLLAVLHLSLLLRRVLGNRVQEEVVVFAVMPQFSRGDVNDNLIVYI